MLFREFLLQTDCLFFEMSRRIVSDKAEIGAAIPIFDDADKAYYKYIIDNVPEQVRNNEKFLAATIRQAICKRYGNQLAGGKLAELHDTNKETLDTSFNIGGKVRFTIDNIPFNTSQVWEKCVSRKWGPKKASFGYKAGNCSSLKMERKAVEYIKYFADGTEPGDEYKYYHPKHNEALDDSSYEEEMKYIASRERGVHKPENIALSRDEIEREKSTGPIPLDEEDKKYLDSVEREFLNTYGGGAGMLFYDEDITNLAKKVKEAALVKRYSDHWINQEKPDGKFFVKDIYTDKDHPEGLTNGKVELDVGKKRKHIVLNNVYLNLPHLAKKFEQYSKLHRNFVARPLSASRQQDLIRARDWINSEKYHPNWALRYGAIVRDPGFRDQIFIDHETWRTGGGKTVIGKPIKDPKVATKCTWRRNLMGKEVIAEDPVVEDIDLNRNIMEMPFYPSPGDKGENIIHSDATIAFHNTIKFLSDTRFAKDKGFSEWAKHDENKFDAIQQAQHQILDNKSGVDDNKTGKNIRHTSMRLKWASNIIDEFVVETYTGRGKGREKDEDDAINPLDQTAARDQGAGDYHVRGETEPMPAAPTTPKVGASGEELEKEIGRKAELPIPVPSKEQFARISATLGMTLRPLVWAKMKRQDKINALRASGLPAPEK